MAVRVQVPPPVQYFMNNIKKTLIILIFLLCSSLSSAQSWKVYGSYSLMDDATINFVDNTLNFRLMIGVQSPSEGIILSTSFEVSNWNWGNNYRVWGGDWRCGLFAGFDPLTFIDKNSFIKPYIVFDIGYTNLTVVNSPNDIYYGGGLRLTFGKDIIRFFIQYIFGDDYRIELNEHKPGHKIEIGIEFAIPYK